MTPVPSRIVLLPDAKASGAHAAKLRRYRLARVRLAERRDQLPARAAHLARSYD
jgi:hypothetical protein